jgi:lipopolysaccharide transport system permease protein
VGALSWKPLTGKPKERTEGVNLQMSSPVKGIGSRASLESLGTKPTVVILPQKGLLQLDLWDIWQYRELLYFLVWRDLKVRYKQTVIGAAWAILQPMTMMIIFTVIFGMFAKLPSDNLPYPIFAYTALLPWNYFSEALSRGSISVVNEANLIQKIYFPRLLLPMAGVVSPLVDFMPAFGLLLVMMTWYGVQLSWAILTLPMFLLFALLMALSVSLWLSALNVRFRDVKHTVPFLIQVWLYASPVAYPISLVPQEWRVLYSLNPMVGVVEGFRWAILNKESPDFAIMTFSAIAVFVLFLSGLAFFKHMERSFADVI